MYGTQAAWIENIPWIYGCIQGVITLIVSFVGVKYVYNEFSLQKKGASLPLLVMKRKAVYHAPIDNPIEFDNTEQFEKIDFYPVSIDNDYYDMSNQVFFILHTNICTDIE